MQRKVYIETTIPSYYYETRKDVRALAWQAITREWWSTYRRYYYALCSEMVILELEHGSHPEQRKKLSLMTSIERLAYLPIIDDIVEMYVTHKLMPREFAGDGYHLAYASYYGIDFLMTWNCRHLANPNKFQHLHVINSRLGLSTPVICTPEQLLTKSEEVDNEI
jgi:hypothetical protein